MRRYTFNFIFSFISKIVSGMIVFSFALYAHRCASSGNRADRLFLLKREFVDSDKRNSNRTNKLASGRLATNSIAIQNNLSLLSEAAFHLTTDRYLLPAIVRWWGGIWYGAKTVVPSKEFFLFPHFLIKFVCIFIATSSFGKRTNEKT